MAFTSFFAGLICHQLASRTTLHCSDSMKCLMEMPFSLGGPKQLITASLTGLVSPDLLSVSASRQKLASSCGQSNYYGNFQLLLRLLDLFYFSRISLWLALKRPMSQHASAAVFFHARGGIYWIQYIEKCSVLGVYINMYGQKSLTLEIY